MTTLAAPIAFSNGSGSDTLSSGSANSGAHVNGSGAVFNGTAVVTGIDTTGVAIGDLFWGQTSSGRQFSVVASVDSSSQITCDDAFSVSESGRTWAIGGKRKTLDNSDSRRIFANDGPTGNTTTMWNVELEDDQTLSSGSLKMDCHVRLKSNNTTIRTITQTTSNYVLEGSSGITSMPELSYIKLANSNGTPSYGYYTQQTGGTIRLDNCVIGDSTNQLLYGIGRGVGSAIFVLTNTTVHECTSHGTNGADIRAIRSEFINNGGDGLSSNSDGINLDSCVVAGNTSNGINERAYQIDVTNSIIHGNGASGINQVTGHSSTIGGRTRLWGNNITGNGDYGINGNATSMFWWRKGLIGWNNFGSLGSGTNNALGAYNGASDSDTDQNLDPQYTAAGSDNYTPSGTNLKELGFTGTVGAIGNSSATYLDIGLQRQEAAPGGGGTTVAQGIHSIGAGIVA